jgi:hypothetical protein
MTVQWNLGLCRNDDNGNEWPRRYPPYSTINNSIYYEEGSYSLFLLHQKRVLLYIMKGKVIS